MKKLLASQRPLFEKSGLGYIAKEDASSNISSIKFVASSSNTKTIPNKVGVEKATTFKKNFDEVYTSETEHSKKT